MDTERRPYEKKWGVDKLSDERLDMEKHLNDRDPVNVRNNGVLFYLRVCVFLIN